jgi:hypothetical protein
MCNNFNGIWFRRDAIVENIYVIGEFCKVIIVFKFPTLGNANDTVA